MANISANELKKGFIINHNNGMWKVVSTEHVKPGKGGAFIQAELKNIKTNSKLNERFRSEDKVDRLILETVDAQFSYINGDSALFLRMDTYEELELNLSDIGDDHVFLIDDLKVKIELIDDAFVGIVLPENIKLKVIETDPEIKGATVTNVSKPAKLNNGITIQVPSFIKEGELIIVNIESRQYRERA
ncbi:elongation factor P [Candidatus Deianiraea vastatrix]|uniref:Elongation factor P n=1 Tax=Candidatus Deianiraea vastatrix TaxID=2163644 RepID=A0A5B8XDU1_9RICK|nr:elongation factor P [Candidatus Deianiraea vastatrix]QED23400.1 Elongation factor P [Candidatus Deianiraea vastatrix]